jgi:hypothetical protein
LDTGNVGEKVYLKTGVIVLLDNRDRNKYLNTADSLDFPEAIKLSHAFFHLYHEAFNLNCNTLSRILKQSMYRIGS